MADQIPYPELLPILLILLAMLSILTGTLRTGISPMPSSGKAHLQVIRFLEQMPASDTPRQLVECGSGWGNLAFKLAQRFPDDRITGYELSLLPWLTSRLLAALRRQRNLHFVRASFLKQDLSDADILISYLHPQGMQKLQQQLANDPADHTRQLISIYFALPHHQAVEQQILRDLHRTQVYRYRLESGKRSILKR